MANHLGLTTVDSDFLSGLRDGYNRFWNTEAIIAEYKKGNLTANDALNQIEDLIDKALSSIE